MVKLPASSSEVFREKEQTVKNSPRVSPRMASSNQFDALEYGIDMVFKDIDPYLGIPDIGPALEVFKTCKNNHDTQDDRIEALRKNIDHVTFISGSNNRYYRLYTIIRSAIIKYGIFCSSILRNDVPVWKKVVYIIWPESYKEIVRIKERSRSGLSKQLPLPPELPEMPKVNDVP